MLVFYKGYDNVETIQLLNAGTPVSLTAVTKISVKFRGTLYDSTAYASAFDWSVGDGKVNLKLGAITTIGVGTDQSAEVVVFDPSNPNGIVWGKISIKMIDMTKV